MQDPRSVERLRHGDVATLKRLFKANHAKLFPMAYRLTGDRDASENVIREAFRRLWEERADLDVFEPLDLRLVERTFDAATAYRNGNGITGFALKPDRGIQDDALPELQNIADEDLLNYLLFVVDGYSFRELARATGSKIEEVQASVGRALVSLQEEPAI
jgi:DNA-directed RNA polymerase specialized sigma24 family protein